MTEVFTGSCSTFHKHMRVSISFSRFSRFIHKGTVFFSSSSTWWINIEKQLNYSYVGLMKSSLFVLPPSLTSDVLHGDGAGSRQFPRHPEGFVTQLLINQRTFEQKNTQRFTTLASKKNDMVKQPGSCSARLTSFTGRLQQQVDRIQGEDGDGHEENPVNRPEGCLAACWLDGTKKQTAESMMNRSRSSVKCWTWDFKGQLNDLCVVLTDVNEHVDI